MIGGIINIVTAPIPVTDAQALTDIDSWIGELGEYQLQEEFDYIGTFRKNIDFLIQRHGEWDGVTPIAEHGIFAVNEHCRTKQDMATNVNVDWDPGYICMIVLTDKWQEAQGKLHKYTMRASLPADVRSALKDMETTVNTNMYTLGNLLEDAYRKEPNLIFKANSQGTKYFNRLLNTYRGQLLSLEPQAKNINALIAQHLQK